MPWAAVTLRPGVDTVKTLSLNEAGVSASQLIRYRDGLIETYGGWANWAGFTINSTIRDLHPWQDINGVQHLGAAATQSWNALTVNSSNSTITNQVITPQTTTTNPTPNFSVTASSNVVTVVDANANASKNNTVFFNTPVSVGSILLNGAYPITTVLSTGSYTITAAVNSSFSVASSGILPKFAISSGSQTVTVTMPFNGYSVIPGLFEQFIAPTTVGTSIPSIIQGKYQVASIIDSTNFTINLSVQASTTATATMNSSLAQLVYYVTQGAPASGLGFGGGAFGGSGGTTTGFGGTTGGISVVGGTPITTTDWTQDNWGEIILGCPKDGPVYAWAPDFGFTNAQVVNQAPFFNGGLFVAMPQQILVLWRSCQASGVQDPLIVRWSNQGDYTNWTVSNQTTAGSFHIPTGSYIVGGIQCPSFALISTDIDVWNMNYVGGTVIFNFTRIGSGCGWISSHACGILGGNPFWMANNNFFTLGANGVAPMPCPIWDQVFQNISTNPAYVAKIRVAVNSIFNEIAWFYPSAMSTGENDSYAKVRIIGNEYEWDYGTLNRTAWTDVSIVGNPIGADSTGQIYQHEEGTSITGTGLPTFQSGYWAITEGEDIPFIDLVIPDFIWGLKSGSQNASINITFYGVNYPGDTPTVYGPYTVTQATEYINVRIRNRLMSVLVQSNANSEFWRLGRIRFRFAASGRR